MSLDDIINLAREAGIDFQQHRGITGAWNTSTCGSQAIEKMERFAALVAAAEREASAKVCENAIASIFEFRPEEVKQTGVNVCKNLAKAIRARGQS